MHQKQVKLSGAFSFKEYNMPKKFTPMQEAFRKEQKRLLRAITKELRQTGIELDKSLIPQMPSRVTQKKLDEIKQIKPQTLREKSELYRHDTGERVTYEEAKRLWQEEQVLSVNPINYDPLEGTIDFYFDSISMWNKNFQSIMRAWIRGLVDQYGTKAVNAMLFDGIRDGIIVTPEIAYEETKRAEYQSAMMSYLKMTPEVKAKLSEEMEKTDGYNVPE